MLGNTVRKVTWMARATTTIVGLTIMLALVFGVATTALAGTGIGAAFNLGQTNTVNAVSKLVGNIAGPSLQIDNNSTGTGATALDLQVEAGKAPMKVNANAGKATNLNADKVDGKDANGLTRVAFAQNDPRRIERDTTLETSITAPSAGFLLINAGTHVEGNNSVIGFIEVDGTPDSPSKKETSVAGSEIFMTETVVPIAAGEHTVLFKAFSNTDATAYEDTTLSALFVPFDGSGASPSLAAISAAQ
jgi:hypothetical protein